MIKGGKGRGVCGDVPGFYHGACLVVMVVVLVVLVVLVLCIYEEE